MKVVIIVQARMTSTRLPGKVLKTVLNKPLLSYQIERLLRVSFADQLIIATTINESDECIVELCKNIGVSFFRGDEHDVLSRYYGAAKENKADIIVRVTSDCPLIDPEIIDGAIQRFFNSAKKPAYVSNVLHRTYPRGMDTEVFSMKALTEAFAESIDPVEREHVTPFIVRRPERYPQESLVYPIDYSHHRWTVDTPEDFALISKILSDIYPKRPKFSLKDCINLLKKNPEWCQINANVEQKAV